MEILPIDMMQKIGNINGIDGIVRRNELITDGIANTNSASFLDVFKGMYDNVVETNAQVDRDAIDVMLGNIDDLAAVQANIEKAGVAVDLLVTTKNEVLSAYNTIINMQI